MLPPHAAAGAVKDVYEPEPRHIPVDTRHTQVLS
jgi:hypothetical protein